MLGEELRKARTAAKISQTKLSLESGVDRSYISEIEHGKKSPTLETLFRLCDALGIRASTLIARVEKSRSE
jgi:transcriptional regulator with XRE-family HTH domain